MNPIPNLYNLGSMVVQTLFSGSIFERIGLGTALFTTGTVVANGVIQLVSGFFARPRPRVTLPRYELSQQAKEDLERKVREKYFLPFVEAPKNIIELNNPVPRLLSYSSLESLTFNEMLVTQEMAVPLARALHAYQELKTKIGKEDSFIFLAMRFLQSGSDGLPSVVIWEEKARKLTIPSNSNKKFADLENQLSKVGLSLKNLIRSENPIALARFKDETSKEIYDLADLYQTVKLHGSHFLRSFEAELQNQQVKQQVEEAKIQLHYSRMNIIDKTLLALKFVLLNDFIDSFEYKYQEFYTIVGSNPETLNFVLDNICWHALDRVFEIVEDTFILSKEAKQKARKIDLEVRLAQVLKDGEKLKQAQACLLQILEKPDNNEAMEALVKLLLAEEGYCSERDVFITKLKENEPQFKEDNCEQELERLQEVQKFYHKVKIAAVASVFAKGLLLENGDKGSKWKIIEERIISPMPLGECVVDNRPTYAKQIDELSSTIVKTGSAAIEEVVDQKWQESLLLLDEELATVSHLSPELCAAIVEQGWVNFQQGQELRFITVEHRWLITKKMIVQRLSKETLQQKGQEILQQVGKRGVNFFNTMYGRLVTAFLAFDQRTRKASKEGFKPADRIAMTFFDTVLQSHQALVQVKKVGSDTAGSRENSILKELEKNEGIHPNALNKPSADTLFLRILILRLSTVLQPEGLAEDIRRMLTKDFSNLGELEPNFIRNAIQKYSESIDSDAKTWAKSLGVFLIEVLQHFIETKSADNFARALSDLLDPANLNALLIDFLKVDDSKISIVERKSTERKERVKWYSEDEEFIRKRLEARSELAVKIKANQREDLKCHDEVFALKRELASLDLELAFQLLRRLVIANVDSSFAGYAIQFVEDLFELMQYSRIVRHIVFNVLEKSVDFLAQPLDKDAGEFLYGSVNEIENQSAFDFFFSDQLKTNLGDKIATVFSDMSPTAGQWHPLVWMSQTAVKIVDPGKWFFTQIQAKLEKLIKIKFGSDEAVKWSASKLVVTLNNRILAFAQDQSSEGMKTVTASQLRKIIGSKEKKKFSLSGNL